ncbi:MAG: hypothetical protein J6B08_06325 [Ruminiclostridium sp.]|nr:hypothetical protein [Ruminiclostridium sp.]
MYRCRICRTNVKTADISDSYDNDIYKVCGICGGETEKPEVFCSECGSGLFNGDRAFEASDRIYCPDCITAVVV